MSDSAPPDPSPPAESVAEPTDVAAPSPPPAGPAAALAAPSLTEAVGGPLGIAESALPASLFVAVYSLAGQDTTASAIVAVAVAAVLTLARVLRGQTLQFAFSGLIGIVLAGFVVSKTGKAEDFFLPGILLNIVYAAAYVVSIVVRWPLMGIIIASLGSQGMGWRRDPVMLRLYTRVSWVWVALFGLRLAVQLPLYLAGALVALGVARVAMGIPLFACGLWLTWLFVRRGPTVSAATTAA